MRAAIQNEVYASTAIVLEGGGRGARIARALGEAGYRVRPLQSGTDSMPQPGSVDAAEQLAAWIRSHCGESVPDLIHPGTRRWSRSPEILSLEKKLSTRVLAPHTKILALFASRLALLEKAKQLGIPHAALDLGPMQSVREIQTYLGQGTFVLASVQSFIGNELRWIRDEGDLDQGFALWMEELRWNTGESMVFPMRSPVGMRTIELPFARNVQGRFTAFSAVDRSLKIRGQAAVTLCPAQGIDARTLEQLTESARTFCQGVGFVGVGSLEFWVDGPRAWLAGGSAGLSAPFHVWEEIDQTSAIAWQLHTLNGHTEPATVRKPSSGSSGLDAALVLHIRAGDPLRGVPSCGRIVGLPESRERRSAMGWSETDFAYEEGADVAPDSLGDLADVFVFSKDRLRLFALADEAFERFWIDASVRTSEFLIAQLVTSTWVREGAFHSGTIEEEFLPALRPPLDWMKSFAGAARAASGLSCDWSVGEHITLRFPHAEITWITDPIQEVRFGLRTLQGDCKLGRVSVVESVGGTWVVRIGHWTERLRPISEVPTKNRLLAQCTGAVHSIHMRAGVKVESYRSVVWVRSQGTLVPHAIPWPGQIDGWLVREGDSVEETQTLARITLDKKAEKKD